ncbi:MAG: D-alanyl-D-alanine carboxypeptidase [Flavobacteriaceae bacterium]|nr:D-alanyl-D-alanine carboxypeptidase [Flavobacteriaceae bacterium]
MAKYLFILLLSFSFCNGQSFLEFRLKRQLRKIPAFKEAFIGVSVSELETSKSLVSINETKYMTPASNTKLLTYLGAIQNFDSLPSLFYSIRNDSMIRFKSSGYPILLHPFYSDTKLTAFFKQDYDFEYVAPSVSPKPQGPGWSWDDFSYYYASERSAFPIHGNAVGITKANNEIKTLPSGVEFTLESDSLAPVALRAKDSNRFEINPFKLKEADTLYRPFITSDSLFVKLLGQAVGKEIAISTGEDNTVWTPLYTQAEEILYRGLLQNSDNGIAEALLLMIAEKNSGVLIEEKSIDSLLNKWSKWTPDPFIWVDGSGVSRYNMFTPRSLVAVLKEIYRASSWNQITSRFPKGGVSGTLKAYEVDKVYGKTGTLRHNHNLSGYLITKRGKTLVFSMMVNHFITPTSEIRTGIGEVLSWLQRKVK